MLDCGHEPSPHGDHTTGTAHTADNREICWSCADQHQRKELKTAQTFGAYLHAPKTGPEAVRYGEVLLTTWTGGKLATVTRLTKGHHNIGGWLYRFRAVDVHGQHWYGTSPGPAMYARMRRAKHPAHKPPRCPDCGRHPAECWAMPCLGLEIAMGKGFRAMLAWSKRAGLVVRDHEGLKAEIAERKERVG